MRDNEEVWCKHCDEYKVPNELGITKEEAEMILDLMGSEWIQFLEDKEERVMKKLKRFVESEEGK